MPKGKENPACREALLELGHVARGLIQIREKYGDDLEDADKFELLWMLNGNSSAHNQREAVGTFLAATGALRAAQRAEKHARATSALIGKIFKAIKEIKNEMASNN